jgi:alginate O-acetyltransferase complex protein AlgI
MLFNSFIFIFLFLPITAIGFYICKRYNFKSALCLLVLASLYYYAYWKIEYLGLMLGSIFVNHILATIALTKPAQKFNRKTILVISVLFNLLLLGYFKYLRFVVENLNAVFVTNISTPDIILPLAISFFTFQQIAYHVDLYQGKIAHHNLLEYMLFVCFFPQLIAGPIVHHSEMMPQFSARADKPFYWGNISVGLTIFIIGLFKKIVIADSLAPYVSLVYTSAASGETIDFYAAWVAALGYSFQLYFDFSGYSDMAIGCARIFGIRLPCNFFSPYKGKNIIEFWRRWHMTLSRFFRDYIYIPLKGSQHSPLRMTSNLLITMFLGGIWHGASWTFAVWGSLHGVYLAINHLWNASVTPHFCKNLFYKFLAWLVTFMFIVCSWVLFRAENFSSAQSILFSMFGGSGISVPRQAINYGMIPSSLMQTFDIQASMLSARAAMYLLGAMTVVFFLPNTHQLMSRYRPSVLPGNFSKRVLNPYLLWRPNKLWAIIILLILLIALSSMLYGKSEFLYYNF